MISKQEKHISTLVLSAEWNFWSGLVSYSITLQVFFFQVNLFCSAFLSIQYHISSIRSSISFPLVIVFLKNTHGISLFLKLSTWQNVQKLPKSLCNILILQKKKTQNPLVFICICKVVLPHRLPQASRKNVCVEFYPRAG